ncbi:photosystem II protein Y [Oscillatoria sp. CS-180]|nr:photosystem II protein Y [Oscillatoria sp. CS-180]MDB9527182.1 photosystem II protein Y [Oscillatoria sp. CS-180]
MFNVIMFYLFGLIDLRLLLVLSPITIAIAWAMFIYKEPSLKPSRWF